MSQNPIYVSKEGGKIYKYTGDDGIASTGGGGGGGAWGGGPSSPYNDGEGGDGGSGVLFIKYKNKPHFINIDVQGSELEVLKGSIKSLKNTLGLEVEVNFKHIYHDIPLSRDIEIFLNSKDFI